MTDEEINDKYLIKWNESTIYSYREWVKCIPTNHLIQIIRFDKHRYDMIELESRTINKKDKLLVLLEFPELIRR